MSSGRFAPTLLSSPNNVTPGSGNPQYLEQSGDYLIVQGICFIWIKLQVKLKDPNMSGVVKVGGLPVPAAPNGINTICHVSFSNITLDSGFTILSGAVMNGTSEIILAEEGSGKVSTALQAGSIPSTGTVLIHLHTSYPV